MLENVPEAADDNPWRVVVHNAAVQVEAVVELRLDVADDPMA